MLNSNALPFEYDPSHSSYNYYYYQHPIISYYHQPTNYFNHDHLALQFSHISLNEEIKHENPHLTTNYNMSTQDSQDPLLPLESSLEFDESKFHLEMRTSVMIKNIPNKLSREMLMMMLDQHCAQENYKAGIEGSPLSEYDFVYLPMDFVNKRNYGYAFVNFTTSLAGWRLYHAMHQCKWTIFGSKKTCHICYARIQGKEALIRNFKKSCFCCGDKSYLPAVLSPPRNGTTTLTTPAAVGKVMLP